MYDSLNVVEELKNQYCLAIPEKITVIKDSLKFFKVI